jgi:hypothetical protein
VLPVAFAGTALAAEDVLSYSDFFGPRPSALPFGLAAGSTGSYGTVMTVGLSEQSAHPYSQALSFAVAEGTAAGNLAGGPLTAQAMNQLVESQPTAAGANRTLQVKGVAVTGGSVRVRFNQPVDLGRLATQSDASGALRSTQVVVLRGDRVVPGMLIPDPDGAGFSFIPDGGPLLRGEYTLLLRSSADGFVNARGELLDGDYDNRAGGDYRARFKVEALPALLATGTEPAAADPMLRQSTGLPFVADHAESIPQQGDALMNTLLGGAGGVSMLAASLGPWGLALPRRTRPRRVPAAGSPGKPGKPGSGAAPIRVRSGPVVPDATAAALAHKPAAWVAGWLDGQTPRGNDWRIRL